MLAPEGGGRVGPSSESVAFQCGWFWRLSTSQKCRTYNDLLSSLPLRKISEKEKKLKINVSNGGQNLEAYRFEQR